MAILEADPPRSAAAISSKLFRLSFEADTSERDGGRIGERERERERQRADLTIVTYTAKRN